VFVWCGCDRKFFLWSDVVRCLGEILVGWRVVGLGGLEWNSFGWVVPNGLLIRLGKLRWLW
jgi:hypothetical protein